MRQREIKHARWKDQYFVVTYEMAREGKTHEEMAEELGVTLATFTKWKRRMPALQYAILQGKQAHEIDSQDKAPIDTTATFLEYVYQRLPKKIQKLYDKISEVDDEPNAIRRIEKMLAKHGKRTRQHLFLHSLVSSNFNLSEACKKVCIPRKRFDNWVLTDPMFAELIDEIMWHKKNYFEGALLKLVKKGDTSAVIFANKTQNRDRGYDDKQIIEHTGTINHNLAIVKIDALNLDINTRKEILQAIRDNRQKQYELETTATLHQTEEETQ